MTMYVIIGVGAVIIAALAYKIGQLKEQLKNAEKQAQKNKSAAEIAARPHASGDVIRNRMHNGDM